MGHVDRQNMGKNQQEQFKVIEWDQKWSLAGRTSFRRGSELVGHDGKTEPWSQVTWIPILVSPNKLGNLSKSSLSEPQFPTL